MGIPIQPAPYCDSYLIQISKSNLFCLIQYKQLNLKDIQWEEEIVIKTTQNLANNIVVIVNSANFV